MSAIVANPMSAAARSRKWWAAVALLALAFVSLRPACEVWLSHWGAGPRAGQAVAIETQHGHAPHEAACCASVEGAKLVKLSDSVLAKSEQDKSPIPYFVTRTLDTAAISLRSARRASVIPPGIASFYERSARILR